MIEFDEDDWALAAAMSRVPEEDSRLSAALEAAEDDPVVARALAELITSTLFPDISDAHTAAVLEVDDARTPALDGGPGWGTDSRGRRVPSAEVAAAVRVARGPLTQAEVEMRAGLRSATLSRLENGVGLPSLDGAWRLVRTLSLPPDVRQAVIDGASRTPGERSIYETCAGWSVTTSRDARGRQVLEVTPR